MKKIIKYFCLFGLIVLSSCKKSGEGNPLADVSNLGVGSYITLTTAVNQNFNYNTPTSTVSIKIDQYGGEVDKVVLYVVAGANADPTSWKKVKTIPFTGPGTVLSATLQEVATALGVSVPSLNPGTSYTFYNQVVTKDGRTFDVTNTIGALESNSNYKAVLRWTAFVVCPFDPVGFAGSFRVVEDGWADFPVGTVLQVTAATATSITMVVYPSPAYGSNRMPIVVDIVPATGTASVKPQVYGSYGGEFITTKSVGSSNFVFSCVGTITLLLNHTGASDYDNYRLKLQKI